MTDIDLKRLAVDREYWDSVAPEGATHWDMEAELFVSPTHVYTLGGKQQRQFRRTLSSFGRYIPRPPKKAQEVEWDGDGLPPVGVECEFIHPGITYEGWQIGTIKAYFDDRVAIKSNPSIWPACGYAVILIDEELKFRSLKPKHERQREELKAFLSESVCSSNGMNKRQIMGDLTDAILSKYNLEQKP